MLKILDVTVRTILYDNTNVVLPYAEYRTHVIYEQDLPESIQIGENDLTLCRLVAENCLSMESLLTKNR